MIGDSNDEANFPSKILLTDRQVSALHKDFVNNLLVNIKLLKTQLPKLNRISR